MAPTLAQGVSCALLVASFKPLKATVAQYAFHGQHVAAAGWVALATCCALVAWVFASEIRSASWFIYACFLRPLGKTETQADRLDAFYKGQSEYYDATRTRLLRGRRTMLKLAAARLHKMRADDPKRRLIWVDIGGGTGYNLEQMNAYFPLDQLDAVYLIDLCAPLLEVARARVKRHGWKNVTVLQQDATVFVLPEWQNDARSTGLIDLCTMSYSLSMIPSHYAIIDRIERFLHPDGVVGVCDFYVSHKGALAQAVGAAGRQCSWLTRLFWLNWFELDHVDLHPSRRAYLEHRFGCLISFNGRNRMFPLIPVGIPYYVFIGSRADRNITRNAIAFETDCGYVSPTSSPAVRPRRSDSGSYPEVLSLGDPALDRSVSRQSDSIRLDVDAAGPRNAFYYGAKPWRVPYVDEKVHAEFRTWIYGFTWEDPNVDLAHMNIGQDDVVFCITSAGDNALAYAVAAQPRLIHCVDMNGHLLELKLAAISALGYDDFFALFGDGKHAGFRKLLDEKLSPYLSSHAYQFWRRNERAFESSFYLRGYSGHALRLIAWLARIRGLTKHINAMCAAKTLEEQQRIWNDHLRGPIIANKLMATVFANPAFCWNALGVPMNQSRCFLDETTAAQYALDTIDPVARTTLLKSQNYHYHLCLQHRYSRECLPHYLTPEGFASLKRDDGKLMDAFRLHTASIVDVLDQLEPSSITVWIGMDHMDWFDNSIAASSTAAATQSVSDADLKPCELTRAIRSLHRALKPGGRAFWRSAGITPWYAELFERNGFRTERISAREVGGATPIDNVNMYASFWRAVKV